VHVGENPPESTYINQEELEMWETGEFLEIKELTSTIHFSTKNMIPKLSTAWSGK
jgi:hypothetical protein